MPMNIRPSRLPPIQTSTMPSAQEYFEWVSACTRAFLDATVQKCSLSEHVDRTELYRLYKDWCYRERISPLGPHRFYNSVRDVFGVSSSRSHGRRLLRGIRLTSRNSVVGGQLERKRGQIGQEWGQIGQLGGS